MHDPGTSSECYRSRRPARWSAATAGRGGPSEWTRSTGSRRVGSSARCLALAAALAVCALTRPASAEEVIRASPFGPPNHLLNARVLRGWADGVAAATAGRVRVELLPRAAAPPADVLAAVRDGRADVSILSNGASETPLPLNSLVEFAGQTPSAERASVAYQHVLTRFPALVDEFDGVEVLAVFTHGPGALLLAQRDRTAGGDLREATLLASGAGAAAAVRALGAKVQLAPGPAARALLVERKADGTLTAVETLDSFGLQSSIAEVDLMPGGFYTAGFSVLMNKKRWESLSAEDRAAIRSVSGERLARLAGLAWDEADEAALRRVRAAGIPVVTAPDVLMQRVQVASDARRQAWLDSLGVEAIDARNAWAEYRDELGARVDAASNAAPGR